MSYEDFYNKTYITQRRSAMEKSIIFEGYEKREEKIKRCLEKYNISSLQEAKNICENFNIDAFKIVKD